MVTSFLFIQTLLCYLLTLTKANINVSMNVDWSKTIVTSKTYPTLQAVVNPLMTRESLIHDQAFKSLSDLNANFVRFQMWFPYPRIVVAQLEPPSGLNYCKHLNGDANNNNWTVSLQCPTKDSVFNNISFVSWGNPTGFCGNFSYGSCNSNNVKSIVNSLCLNKHNCTINVNKETFNGDPCPNIMKAFAIQLTCDTAYNYSNWEFTKMDELMEDFFNSVNPNNEYNKTVMDFSTIPNWVYKGVKYGQGYNDNPYNDSWGYCVGTELIDETAAAFGEYYGRLVSWYKNGYFIDEYGHKYESNRNKNYNIEIWEVLNEPDAEHSNTPESYTRIYDATIEGIWKYADPRKEIKFMGMSLEGHYEWDWYNYFLNKSNHKQGIPIDYISFHFYGHASNRSNPDSYMDYFNQADQFIIEVENITKIRDKLSPNTKIDIDELGSMLNNDNSIPSPPQPPSVYWNAGGAMYAYLVARLSLQEIDIVGQSQLLGFPQLTQKQFPASPGGLPPQWPSVSILDWNNGIGTAKYWILDLLLKNLNIGDSLVETNMLNGDQKYFYAQGYVRCNDSTNYMLIINKMNENITIEMDDLTGGVMYVVDENTGQKPPRKENFEGTLFSMQRFAVAILYPLV